ncbi:MAG: class I SAM-dependent methyltransferase, partial [Nitrososphaerales archaeon]
MIRATRRACPVCGEQQAEEVAAIDLCLPEGHPLEDPLVVVSCAACSTGFSDHAVGQRDFDAYYMADGKYAEEGSTTAGGTLSLESVATPWALQNKVVTANHLLELVPREASLLDLGCGVGTLLVELQRRGMKRVVGLDPSPRSAEVAALLGADVRTGTFLDRPAGLGRFDAVTMIGVLEHLWDVPAAVGAIRDLLRPGGLLYLDVPDAGRYCHPFLVPFQDFNTEHANHFSLATLELLFARHGFEAVWTASLPARVDASLPPVPAGTAAFRLRDCPFTPPVLPDPALRAELRDFARQSAATMA